MTDSDPLPIPTRVALRLCATVLFAVADRQRAFAGTPSLSRKARGHVPAVDKTAGRLAVAKAAAADATELVRLSREKVVSGDGADAAVLGYLLAWLDGWMDARAQLEAELEELSRPGVLIDHRDRVGTVMRVVG